MKLGLPGARGSPFMASNLSRQMLLESFGTVVYILDSGTFFEVYSSRSAVFRVNRPTSCRMQFFTTHGRCCVQRSGWLVPQVALLHTWIGDDQCSQPPTKVLPLPYPLSLYYYYYYYATYLHIILLDTLFIMSELRARHLHPCQGFIWVLSSSSFCPPHITL